MKKKLSILIALVMALSLCLVPATAQATGVGEPLSGYQIITSPEMSFGDGGWGGWSVPEGKVVLGGGFYATAPVAASAPGTPGSVWPHWTFGTDEYGWVVRDAPDGVGNTIIIYVICADKPAGYGVAESTPLNYADGGWAGWSAPAGKVVLGGGFVLSDPEAKTAGAAAVSVPGTPGSVWPHWTFGTDEYGWVVRAAKDEISDPDSKIYVIYADEPAGYGVITSASLEYGDGGWAGWSVPAGKVVLGGGFNLTGGPAAVSVPGTPGSIWPHYTYGAGEYGWVVRDAPDGASSYGSTVYAIYAELPNTIVGLTAGLEEITAINVTPTDIDFGTLELGQPSDVFYIAVENIGQVKVNVSASLNPIGGVFAYLELNNVDHPSTGSWNAGELGMSGMEPTFLVDCTTQLQVPATYSAQGEEHAVLEFIATPVLK